MKKIIVIYLIFVCYQVYGKCSPKSYLSSINFQEIGGNPKKDIIIYAHGLNSSVNATSTFLKQTNQSFYLVAPTLPGHDETSKNMAKITLQQILDFYDYLFCIVKNKDLPIHFIGHSFGALSFLYALEKINSKIEFQSITLLAPAITPKYSWAIRLLKFLPNSLPIPSLAPKKFRLFWATPLGAYKRALEMSEYLLQNNLTQFKKSSFKIILSKEDHLIDWEKLRKWIKSQKGMRIDSQYYQKSGTHPAHLLFIPAESTFEKNYINTLLDELLNHIQ